MTDYTVFKEPLLFTLVLGPCLPFLRVERGLSECLKVVLCFFIPFFSLDPFFLLS